MDSNHPADDLNPEIAVTMMPEKNEGDTSRPLATDLHQPDFSRLEMARARLDAAFAER